MKTSEIKVVELFAGVGGFRIGLENSSNLYNIIWANQWEPNKKVQHAFNCYASHFKNKGIHINEDIGLVKKEVPLHHLLVGGFPCQDYSVARTGAKGIEGKKGVLWWDIKDIIELRKPNYVLLENVDRLLKSPTNQRGRDFGIILKSLYDDGYAVEWKVINAAEYGFSQRRRRTFIFAYKDTTKFYKKLKNFYKKENDLFKWISEEGFFPRTFNVNKNIRNFKKTNTLSISKENYADLITISEKFVATFYNSGIMIDGNIYTEELTPIEIAPIPLKEIRQLEKVDNKYFLNGSLEKWQYLKGAKKIERTKPNGEKYFYSEGNMSFPDNIDLPARTMLTSESSINRSTHVIEDYLTKKLRLLTPIECERLNGFPDNWTNTGMPEKFRYFCMGNALVVNLITKMGNTLLEII